jgi:hypothetical protein
MFSKGSIHEMDSVVRLDAGGTVGTQHESHGEEPLQDQLNSCVTSKHIRLLSDAVGSGSACLPSVPVSSLVAVSVQLSRRVFLVSGPESRPSYRGCTDTSSRTRFRAIGKNLPTFLTRYYATFKHSEKAIQTRIAANDLHAVTKPLDCESVTLRELDFPIGASKMSE